MKPLSYEVRHSSDTSYTLPWPGNLIACVRRFPVWVEFPTSCYFVFKNLL